MCGVCRLEREARDVPQLGLLHGTRVSNDDPQPVLYKEADAWAEMSENERTNGRMLMEWRWSDVTGICGFGDASCRAFGCGVGMRVKVCH